MENTTSESSRAQVKEKRTRRRQRISCVECTKRRQKCDRQHPCGLCVSRGVAHLCHWASGPISRPAPARPPAVHDSGSPAELSATIKALSERLACLERTVGDQHPSTTLSLNSLPELSPKANTPLTSEHLEEEEEEPSPPAPLQRDVHEAAVTLAQLSLSHHGEYVGNGSILCALHRLGEPVNISLPYSKSTESTTTSEDQPGVALNPVQSLAARYLPPRHITDALLFSFFTECNWRFGIPEKWFRAAYLRMWRALDPCGTHMGAGTEQVNANWLSLLFAMLALAPPVTDGLSSRTGMISRETCFTHALSARRLVEDAFLTSTFFTHSHNATDGTVLGCVATVLMSSYLAARGRVSEAWKLIGGAIRAGQAAGMHRDPAWVKWQVMCEEERVLRRRGWWALVVCDQLYSNVLGRPAMVSGDVTDVPPPSLEQSDDTEDQFDAYQATLVKLCEVVGEAGLQCIGPKSTPYALVLQQDRRYDDWLNHLPEQFRWYSAPQGIPSTRAEHTLNRQRHTIGIWYLACRMNLHRPWLTRRTPPVLPLPANLVGLQNVVLNPSREKCITLAMELVHMQCEHTRWPIEDTDFTRTFFVFDGAVTLISALAYAPDHPSAGRCIEVVERAIRNLQESGKTECQGEIAKRATEVLGILRRAGGWTRGNNAEQHGGSTWTNGNGSGSYTTSPLSFSNLAPTHETTPQFYSQKTPLIYRHPSPQHHLQLQSRPPSYFSADQSMFSSTSPPVPSEGFDHPHDRENIWARAASIIWNNYDTHEMDLHTMMPFEMLQGLPLN